MTERQLKARLRHLEHDWSGDYYHDVVHLKSGAVFHGDIVNRDRFPDGLVQIETMSGATPYVHVEEIAAVT